MKSIQKIFTCTLLIIFTQSLFAQTYANSLIYSKQVRGKIMENFKQEQFNNIYNNANWLLKEDVNFFETQNKIMMFETIRDNNKEQKEELDIQRQVISDRVTNLEDAIALIDADIEKTQNEILSLSRNIVALYSEINMTKDEIEEKNKEIYESRKILLEYIAHIYKKQNVLYSWEYKDIDSLKTVLLSDGTLWDILSELHFTSVLEVAWQSLVEQYRRLVKELFVKKLDLEKKNKNLKNTKSQELIKRKSLIEKKQFREKILDYTKGQEELFTQYVKEKIKVDTTLKIKIIQNKVKLKDQKSELLAKYNCNYLDEKLFSDDMYLLDLQDGGQKDCMELNKILTLESQLKPFSQNKQNVFLWPIQPEKWISAYYKDPGYLDVVWASHDAIDIIAPQATDIIAPADGYITYVKEPTDEWYAYAVLKHANGFVTVYGHINEVLFKQYDFIKAGTVFARSGGEVGTNWAGLMTTGPHLHFEVYKDREYVDPLNYLDLTVLSEDKVPPVQKYAYKYVNDYKERYWEEYTWDLLKNIVVFKLTWETEIDRQKDLLSKYATSEFNNWDMWVEEAVDGNIDPSFLMCIGLAESWLGRNLKTSYNVWNIGNTDSGSTWEFPNARSWVYRMAKTLNNQFLWDYKEMSKLSRYGNKTGSIYASSPINWHNNMVKCLQALKAEHIPDNFNFRLQ